MIDVYNGWNDEGGVSINQLIPEEFIIKLEV